MKILICGATGFMGRNIVEYFVKNNKYEVHATRFQRPEYDLLGVTWHQCDLKDAKQVEKVTKGMDIVVQAAATTSGSKDIVSKPYLHVTDNAVMNSLILRSCFDNNVGHFLFLSCGVMYNPDRSPVKEEDHYLDEEMPKNYFGVGWTKIYVEKMCDFYSRLGKTKHTSIRHSNTYGSYDKYDLEKSHMFGATITKVMEAKEGEEIIVWGDGKTERDLLYVSDVVDFIEKAIEKQQNNYELVNVGYGESFSVKEIVEKIIKYSEKNLKIKFDLTKPSINTKLALDSKKALDIFGWKAQTSLDEGIKKTIKWYKNNF